MGVKPAPGKGLRIASGCSTLDEFTAVFRKFCTPNSIFIATKVPRPSGIQIHFAITLKDGKPVMSGAGTIKESFETENNRYQRPGMVVEFTKLDTMGRILLRELNAGATPPAIKGEKSTSQDFEIPTIVQDPDEDILAAARPSKEIPAAVPDEDGNGDTPNNSDTSNNSDTADTSDAGVETTADAEETTDTGSEDSEDDEEEPKRTKGSSIVLPANPFGELTATSLEAFVECTLYEETSEVDISGMVSALGDEEYPVEAEEEPKVGALGPLDDVVPAAPALDSAAPDASSQEDPPTSPTPSSLTPRPPKLQGLANDGPVVAVAPASPAVAPSENSQQANLASPGLAQAPVATPPPTPPPPQGPEAVALDPLSPAPAVAAPSYPIASAAYGAPLEEAEPTRTITFTWHQAVGLVALCVVAGLGFGLLAGDEDEAKRASTDASRPKATAATTVPAPKEPTTAPKEVEPASEVKPVTATEPSVDVDTDFEAAPDEPVLVAEPIAEPAPEPDPAPIAEPALAVTTTGEQSLCHVVLDSVPKDPVTKIGAISIPRGATEMDVPCGTHTVRATHPRYQDHKSEFVIEAGQEKTLRLRMKRPIITLRVKSTPSRATVTFNKRSAGKAPIARKIPAFESVKVSVSSPGYQTYSKKVYPKKSSTMNVRLKKTRRRSSTTGRKSR